MTTPEPTHTAPLVRGRRFLSVAAIVGSALIGIAACGSASATDDTHNRVAGPTTTTTVATTPTTTAPAPAPTTVAAAPATATVAAAPPVDRPTQPLDELVGAEGSRVHIRCVGSGATTVLLIAGFEAGADGWSAVESALSPSSRVCSYERPGTGSSDPPTSTQTFATQVAGLRALLETVGEPGPYVVVGHSFGGAEAVTFASQDTDVVGLVLVDASAVTWPAALCAVTDNGSDGAAVVVNLCGGWSDPTSNSEHLDVFAAFDGASTIATLGSLPMSVITAVDRELPPGLDPADVARLTDAWNQGQQQWRQLTTNSRLVSVEHTGHHIEIDHPDVVVDEIARLLP